MEPNLSASKKQNGGHRVHFLYEHSLGAQHSHFLLEVVLHNVSPGQWPFHMPVQSVSLSLFIVIIPVVPDKAVAEVSRIGNL